MNAGVGARRWQQNYSLRLLISDFLVLVWVVYGTQIVWFGTGNADIAMREFRFNAVSYWVTSALIILLWLWALSLADSRSYRVIGAGTTEYARVLDGSIRLFGLIAIFAFLFRVDIARGYLLISLPLGIVLLLLVRWLWRQWLVGMRRQGRFLSHTILVGSPASVAHTARELEGAQADGGFLVTGAYLPHGVAGTTVAGTDIPILGDFESITAAINMTDADTVAVTSSAELPPDTVKLISWALEPGRQHLVLAPGIADVAGPRIHMRPVAGLPLLHVETPRLSAGQRVLKKAFDLIIATIALVLVSPIMAIVACAVAWTSAGPVLYASERVGLNGKPFKMLKFRSMRVGADAELATLLAAQGRADRPLFKIKDDPRITPVGRFIRKYSLDELPQLFNVLGGSMSLIGPRPQVAAEVALYSDAAKRRLLARPGITGLWQVSGRSTLDWDEAVKLDLYYVENWTLAGDVTILIKTAKVVLTPGATAH